MASLKYKQTVPDEPDPFMDIVEDAVDADIVEEDPQEPDFSDEEGNEDEPTALANSGIAEQTEPAEKKAKRPWHYTRKPCLANENNGKQIAPRDIKKMEWHFSEILRYMQIDWQNDQNTANTPHRFVKMLLEATRGRRDAIPSLTCFDTKCDQVVIVGPITVKSMCSHHFLPVQGHCWVGIIPNGKLLGLSKFSRLVDWVFRRPQIQEHATEQLADEFEKLLDPLGIAIVVDAAHMCQQWRGIEDETSRMKTQVMRGVFMEKAEARAEFMGAIK